VQVMLLLSWSHLALFSARDIPIFVVVAMPGVALAMREWLEYARVHCSLRSLWKFGVSLAELEAGLQIIANRHKRDRWHFCALFGCATAVRASRAPGPFEGAAR
jgi:hypothetical protein